MPKKSTIVATTVVAALVVVGGAATALALSGGGSPAGKTVVRVGLWDDAVAAAYTTSFAEFEKANDDIDVQVEVTPWASYWDDLLVDVGGKTAPDIYWLNSNFTAYADNGNLVDIGGTLGADAQKAWDPSVVEQYTRDGKLWGVPQLADGGKAIIYNKDLVARAGLTEADLRALVWNPDGTGDTLVPALKKLTLDSSGRDAADPEFDPKKIAQYGYNAAYDSDAILFNFVGSNGGSWNSTEQYTFADDASAQALRYVVDLINTEHVAPSAADTNENGDFSKDQFLQGKLALFQTGLYNVANVADGATFDWGVVPVPAGPKGALSVTNGIIAAGNADSANPEATQKVLEWLGSTTGSTPIGSSGAAVPAVLDAQKSYFDTWAAKGIDVTTFFDAKTFALPILNSPNVPEASAVIQPALKEIFLGGVPVAQGLKDAQDAANSALTK